MGGIREILAEQYPSLPATVTLKTALLSLGVDLDPIPDSLTDSAGKMNGRQQ